MELYPMAVVLLLSVTMGVPIMFLCILWRNRAGVRADAELYAQFGDGDAASLTETQILEFREMFELADVDHGGTISLDELAGLFSRLGQEPTVAEIQKLMHDFDDDRSGGVDFEEFCMLVARQLNPNYAIRRRCVSFRIACVHVSLMRRRASRG